MVSFVMDIRSTRSAEDMTYNILDLDGARSEAIRVNGCCHVRPELDCCSLGSASVGCL